MKSTRLIFFTLVVLVAASGASCPRRLSTTGPLPPEVFFQPPGLQQVIAAINANTARVQRLQASSATLSVSGFPSLKTSLALERPLRFRMQAGTGLTGTELDLGSNDELFWMWAKRNDPPATYYARHADAGSPQSRQLLPVSPSWLIEALGLVAIDPQGTWDGPYSRGAGRLEIRGQVATPSGNLTKVIVVDDRRGLILEQHVYDNAGQLLAASLASEHSYDSVHQVTLPRRVNIQLPPAGLAFTLDVDGYNVNQIVGDAAQLWSLPQVPGSPLVPLADAVPLGSTAPPPPTHRRDWQLATAPPPTGPPAEWRTAAEFMR